MQKQTSISGFVEGQGLYAPDGSSALYDQLERIRSSLGPLSLYIRRLAWVPVNFPVQIGDACVSAAESYLIDVEDDPQVLADYWVSLDDLVRFCEVCNVSLADIEVFGAHRLSLLVGLTYFETYLRQWSPIANGIRTLPRLEVSGTNAKSSGLTFERHANEQSVFIPQYGMITSLTEEALSNAQPLVLKDAKAVAAQANLVAIEEALDLQAILSEALSRSELVFVSHEFFQYELPASRSSLSTVDELGRDLETHLKTPYGTFQFFNWNWEMVLSATKRKHEDTWTVTRIERSWLN